MKAEKTVFPYIFYYLQVAGLTLLGLLTSLYLAYIHYKIHTDISFSSFCAITQAINCDTVAESPWSIFWGLPLAFWGIFAYAMFFLLLIPLRHQDYRKNLRWSLLIILPLLFSSFSLYLAIISATKIHSWCLLCILTYAINLFLTFSSWIMFRRFSTVHFLIALPSAIKELITTSSVKLGIPVLIFLLIIARLYTPTYWIQEAPAPASMVAFGVTADGNPWIGAKTPQFVIEEFTDYQCFQCNKVHLYLTQLINQHPDRIRLIHHNYPLDNEFNRIIAPHPFHIGSGKLALIAIVAIDHNAFWVVNDALYRAIQTKHDSINIDEFAKLMHISPQQLATEMNTEKVLRHLQHDIAQGLKYKIIGTPSFVIDGKMYPKTLPSELLKKMIQRK